MISKKRRPGSDQKHAECSSPPCWRKRYIKPPVSCQEKGRYSDFSIHFSSIGLTSIPEKIRLYNSRFSALFQLFLHGEKQTGIHLFYRDSSLPALHFLLWKILCNGSGLFSVCCFCISFCISLCVISVSLRICAFLCVSFICCVLAVIKWDNCAVIFLVDEVFDLVRF